jgi:hypothetical protein
LIDSTTTPTQLSQDEYELLRDIRTVRMLNRLKAHRSDNANLAFSPSYIMEWEAGVVPLFVEGLLQSAMVGKSERLRLN